MASASVQTAEPCSLGGPDGSGFEGVGDIVGLQPHANAQSLPQRLGAKRCCKKRSSQTTNALRHQQAGRAGAARPSLTVELDGLP